MLNTFKLNRVEHDFLLQFSTLQNWLNAFYARPTDLKSSYRLQFDASSFVHLYGMIKLELEGYTKAIRLNKRELGKIQHLADRLYREAKELGFQVETIKICWS